MRVVVVGAGLAGAACASRLVAEGVHVVVLDKSRGPGGRTATRRATVGGAEVRFDHGSAVLQLDSLAPHVRSRVEQARAEGVLVGWTPRVWRAGVVTPGDAVCIGIPGNNALAAHLLRGVEVRAGVTVGQVRAFSRGWEVLDVDGARVDEADAVVVAVPAPQAATLVREARPDWALPLADVPYAITVVGMAAWGHAPDPGWDVALGRSPDLARIVWQDGVPGRSAFGAFVVEAGAARATMLSDAALPDIGAELGALLAETLGLPSPAFTAGHRWRFATCEGPPLNEMCHGGLAVCGDAFGSGVSGALRSGEQAAIALMG